MSETSVLRHEVRPGAYADSVVLMQLQAGLAELDGVVDAAAVMATPANLELLEAGEDDLGHPVLVGGERIGTESLGEEVDHLPDPLEFVPGDRLVLGEHVELERERIAFGRDVVLGPARVLRDREAHVIGGHRIVAGPSVERLVSSG